MKISSEWMNLLLPLIVFVGIFLFRYLTQFAKARKLKEIAPYLNGEAVIRPFFPPRIRGTYMGMPFELVFLPAGRGTPARLQLRMEFAFPFVMEIRRRGTLQGLEQLFLRGKEIETGDEAFDASLVTRVDKDPDKARVYLDNPANREGILEVFREGFDTIRFTPQQLLLTRQGDFLVTGLSQEQALRDLALGARLMQAL